MIMNILKVEGLSHSYNRRSWAIKDIGFEINKKGIIGLLGSNGAGKSTTMNIICGVLSQTAGTVVIGGINLRREPEAAKKKIGFLPQNPPLHMDLTVDEYLIHSANIRLMNKRTIAEALELVKEKCGISHFSKRLLRNLSGGYRQRVGIAQAIIHTPDLVIMDEPTNGLDPNQIIEVRNLIKEIGKERAVIFSSHILSEVQSTCQEVKMIENGKMVFEDTMDAFNNYINPESLLAYFENPPIAEELEDIAGVTHVAFIHPKLVRIKFNAPRTITEHIVEMSVSKGWALREINLERSSLDEVFAQLSGKAGKSVIN
jgi:ABC-2 type transport system ATP-binding protein